MSLKPFNIVGGSYQDDTRPFDFQDSVNFIPAKSEVGDSRSPSILRGAPGWGMPAATIGTGPIRGGRDVNGVAYIVSGTALYKCVPSGDAYTTTNLGTIAGSHRVSISHNQIANGHQIIVVNGATGYVYNDVTNTLTTITDSGYPGSGVVDFIDTYFPQVSPDGTYWFVSALLDGLSYNTLDRFTVEADPNPILGLIVTHEEVWVLGAKVIQPFVNTGQQNITFQPAQGSLIQQGVASRFTAINLDNSVFWLDNNGIFRRSNGYNAIRISTHPVEEAISGLKWSNAFSFAYVDRGHSIYYTTFPDGHTWGYDIATGLWHRRQSYNLNRWRISMLIYTGGKWLAGDYENGNLYVLDWDKNEENGVPMLSDRIAPYVSDSQNLITMNQFEALMNTGQGNLDGNNYLLLRYSDDGGRNWSNWKQASLGAVGQYGKRCQFTQLGQFRSRLMHLRVSSPVKRDIIAAGVAMEEEQ